MRRSVLFLNHSGRAGTVCIFQTDSALAIDGLMSLAWLTKEVNPTTRVAFCWDPDYVFVWYDSTRPAPGMRCVASQVRPAYLTGYNQVGFSKNPYGFLFQDQTEDPASAGALYIVQDGTIPLDQATVGIGMAGQGALVARAQPNLIYKFVSPNPQYWITFGSFRAGEVLDVAALTTPVAQIDFPDNVDTMIAVLDTEERWTVRAPREPWADRPRETS